MKLFAPQVPECEQHPNYRRLIAEANRFKMDVLMDWARGFVDRDNKFAKEFNSSFWELYLHAVLKHYGMSPDFSQSSPDFVLPAQKFCIEAVVASNAEGKKPEHEKNAADLPKDLNEFNRRAMTRVANSLVSKQRKFLKSYSKLSHVKDRPFVVALASFDQPFSHMECQRAIEAVLHGYYVDEEKFLASGRENRKLEGEQLLRISKDNGSEIELGMFERPDFKEISAVLFNGCATIGKVTALSADPNPNIWFEALRSNAKSVTPTIIKSSKANYCEHLLDGLRIYHNPLASHPLDPSLFHHPKVFQSYRRNSEYIYEQQEGLLLFRSVVKFVARKQL